MANADSTTPSCNNQTNYCGISTRAPYVVHWWDVKGVRHESSFEDAPRCSFWNEIPQAFQKQIVSQNKKGVHHG